jgi:uncharacterized phage-associated protein
MEHKFSETSSYSDVVYTSLADKPQTNPVAVGIAQPGMGKVEFNESNVKDIPRSEMAERTVSVFDVACYILHQLKQCTTMKLHKLLYYCQAWTLVWDERPLFHERIEAWANGPVIRELFIYHKGMFQISESDMSQGNEQLLSDRQRGNIDEVLRFYGSKSSQWLIDQTHLEAPWIDARKGLSQTERGNRVIENDAMYQYYSSLK